MRNIHDVCFSGSNVSAYIGMVCDTLKNTIPKAVVYCQVREAKRALLSNFYAQVGRREVIFRTLPLTLLILILVTALLISQMTQNKHQVDIFS